MRTTDAARVPTAIKTLAPGSNGGNTLRARASRQGAAAAVGKSPKPFQLVIHGDDPDVVRPAVPVVYWVGAAEPANGAPWDFWYPDTV
jgi:hypothetical protein